MKICVVGWYFRPAMMKAVEKSRYEAFVIKHREGDTCGIPGRLYENLGLEVGAYRQYMENHWDGQSDVLFCHDDAEVSGTNVFDQVASLADMDIDHAYIFRHEYEELVNNGCHGRGMWARGSWLALLQQAGGFPADMSNRGDHCSKDANRGIFAFHRLVTEINGHKAGIAAVVPGFHFARRGWMAQEMYVFRRTGPVIVTPVVEE